MSNSGLVHDQAVRRAWLGAAGLTHGTGVLIMVVATLLWATAGAMARQVHHAQGVEITFWRSVLAFMSMVLLLGTWRGWRFWQQVQWREPLLWLSGACWSVMFTAFMMAMSFTTVANVLIMSALGPVFTALASRIFLRHPLPARTWLAIGAAAVGIFYIYGAQLTLGDSRKLTGSMIALLVPLAGCAQWTLMHREKERLAATQGRAQRGNGALPQEGQSLVAAELPEPLPARDMLPALLIGSALSALMCLPFVFPMRATVPDMAWLAALGFFQLAVPCALAVVASRVLHAPELALLALLEVVFGILLTWWGAGEAPGPNVLLGGAVVVGALAINELFGWRQQK